MDAINPHSNEHPDRIRGVQRGFNKAFFQTLSVSCRVYRQCNTFGMRCGSVNVVQREPTFKWHLSNTYTWIQQPGLKRSFYTGTLLIWSFFFKGNLVVKQPYNIDEQHLTGQTSDKKRISFSALQVKVKTQKLSAINSCREPCCKCSMNGNGLQFQEDKIHQANRQKKKNI